MVIVAILSYGSYIALFLFLGVPGMPAVNAIATLLSGIAWWMCERGYLRSTTLLMGAVVLGHIVPATLSFGWGANFHLFAFLFIAFALLSPEFRLVTKGAIVLAVTSGYVYFGTQYEHLQVTLPGSTITLLKVLNTIMFSATLSGLAIAYSAAIWRATESVHVLNAKLKKLATVDPLTGLLNRRSMNELLQQELIRFERTGRSFAVVIGDIDDFKAINDRHGHNVGDLALSSTAHALSGAVREVDHVGRWGGEEFVLLLPETDAAAAFEVARRVQESLRGAEVRSGDTPLRVSMTFGVSVSASGRSADDILAAADRALYEGKRSGKDRVVLAA